MTHSEAKTILLKDKKTKAEYDRLGPRYEIVSQILDARKQQGMTQAELAKRCGTQKSHISRMESGNYNPSLDFLIKIADGLGKQIHVTMT